MTIRSRRCLTHSSRCVPLHVGVRLTLGSTRNVGLLSETLDHTSAPLAPMQHRNRRWCGGWRDASIALWRSATSGWPAFCQDTAAWARPHCNRVSLSDDHSRGGPTVHPESVILLLCPRPLSGSIGAAGLSNTSFALKLGRDGSLECQSGQWRFANTEFRRYYNTVNLLLIYKPDIDHVTGETELIMWLYGQHIRLQSANGLKAYFYRPTILNNLPTSVDTMSPASGVNCAAFRLTQTIENSRG